MTKFESINMGELYQVNHDFVFPGNQFVGKIGKVVGLDPRIQMIVLEFEVEPDAEINTFPYIAEELTGPIDREVWKSYTFVEHYNNPKALTRREPLES